LDSGELIGELKKKLAKRMLSAAINAHSASEAEAGVANYPNGHCANTALTPGGSMELSSPRDCHRRFDPVLTGKYRRRSPVRSIVHLLQRPHDLICR
jgi:transposase-like protein